jgi:hypothetical protein
MPKLLAFSPCEKVIIAQDDNNSTLIAILSEINGEYEAEEQAVPPDAMAPFMWAIFTMWHKEDGDDSVEYEQITCLVSPAGQHKIDDVRPFTMSSRTHRLNARVIGIPLVRDEEWTLQLFIRRKGQPTPSVPLATYPLKINFTPRKQSPEPTK